MAFCFVFDFLFIARKHIPPRFRCATLDRSDQTIWVAHRWRGATQITWSGKRLSRTMVWTMVALRSDQRAKCGKWSGQWSHDGLIRVQSLENGLDNGRTTVWSEGKVWEVVWTMVALRSDQSAKSGKWSGQWSHDGLIRGQSLGSGLDNGRTTVWSEGKVAL